MNKLFRILLVIALAHCHTFAGNIHIGAGRDFPTIEAACPTLKPGDSVFVHSGTYDTYQYYLGLKGTPDKWITITKAPNETVEINGGWQFTSSEYIRIEKLVFKTNAKYNNTLLHFDHAGDCTKLSNHIIIDSCSFLDVAGGNTFKLGGVSDFEVSNCRFVNNTSGFAGIALNESRNGVIRNCYFENIKTKGIQFKLGTMNVVVYGNYFKNTGLDDSALKIGESGGKEFYCPDAKDWHAKDIKIFSNIFVGGKTPFSIGLAINSEITNNTIVAPATFVMRLLSDEAEYENKNNKLTNNLFYLDKTIYFNGTSGAKNIDFPSIVFQNNLFYSASKPTWTGPNPNGGDYDAEEIKGVQFINSIIANPLLKDIAGADFNLSDKSPALGAGMAVQAPMLDYFGNPFRQQRCIGAIETGSVQSIINVVSVGLNMTNATMNVGDSLPLVATVAPQNATNKSLQWNTSQPSIASVSNAGVVKALSAGTAEITVTTVDGNFKAKCFVLVTNPIVAVQSITLTTNTASMRTGDSLQLTATILPQNASNKSVTWSSATTTIATVSSNGMVKALSAGKVDIAATTIDGGFKAICTIQVTNPSGVDEKALSGHILLSPNPVNDELQFTLPHPSPFDMEIFSAIGVRVLQANTSRINIEHLSSGMYWVRIRQGSKVYYGSFVKK
ncbi:MAG: Ig-like domain-containing protein [Candidatus Kapaibacterium sp.]